MTKILVSVDGSGGAEHVLPHVAALAGATGASIHILRVLDPLLDAHGEFVVELETAVKRVEEQWLAGLRELLARFGLEGEAEVRRLPRRRDVSDIIAAAADDLEADVIALHSYGSGALRHMFRGDTVLDVAARSGVPVFATGSRATAAKPADPYRLLVTTDGSEAARAAFGPIRQVLGGAPVPVTLLRVVEGKVTEAAAREAVALDAAAFEGYEVTTDVRPCARGENVSQTVLRAASEANANAIAMATHGTSALRHVLAGSTALGVLGRAEIPVILVRPF